MNTRERPAVGGLGRSGAIMMMTAGFALVLLSMTAMVTDVGYMYYSQAKLQTAVNAGWKAGYDKMIELTGTKTELDEPTKEIVRRHVKSVLSANGFGQEDLKSIDIIIGKNNDIRVVSRKEVGLFFARVMNIDSAEVAAGRQNHPDSKFKVVPFGIPHGVVRDVSKNVYTWDEFDENEGFKKDEEYILKLGEGEVVQSGDIVPFGLEVRPGGGDSFGYQVGLEYSIKGSPGDPTFDMPPTGNFGALALGGKGANDYGDVILNGYDDPLNIGDWVDSEPGNMAGKTIDNVQERIRRGETNILIPVVSDFGNGRKPVQILGFLNFTLVGTGLEGKGGNAKATVRAIFTGVSDADLGRPKQNYGIIDPDNTRSGDKAADAQDYVDRTKNGYNGVLNMDDYIIPEKENLPEETDEAIDYRLENERFVIVPITKPGDNTGENSSGVETIYDLKNVDADNPDGVYTTSEGHTFTAAVEIIGFAKFRILDPEDEYEREGDNYEEGDSGDLGIYRPGQVRGQFVEYIAKPE